MSDSPRHVACSQKGLESFESRAEPADHHDGEMQICFSFFLQLYCVNCCFPRRWKYLCRFNSRCGEKKRKTKKNGEITSCNGHRRSYRKCTEHDERLRGFKNNFCCLSICSCRPGDLMTHPRWGATDKIFSSLSPWHRIIYSTAQLRADDFSISIFLLGFRNM